MRNGFRWSVAVLVFALMLPTAAGALPATRSGFPGEGWTPWSRIVAFVTVLFGGKSKPEADTGCGIDGSGLPKCNS